MKIVAGDEDVVNAAAIQVGDDGIGFNQALGDLHMPKRVARDQVQDEDVTAGRTDDHLSFPVAGNIGDGRRGL